MRRSLGDKRRKIGEKEDGHDQITEIVRIYGNFENSDLSKIFDNSDFGFTRVTVERPLRLRFQMTLEDKARFLDAYPDLLDDVQAIDEVIGRKPSRDWNLTWDRIEDFLHERGSRWNASARKLFRAVFTTTDPEAEPVAMGRRNKGFEPDPSLRDSYNIPLKGDVDTYFRCEVLPHVSDAWMDRAKDKVGYEISFNRHFFKYTSPRSLEAIDADLKRAEDDILRLLREVTD
jgi:type I restriction enzyme M protein